MPSVGERMSVTMMTFDSAGTMQNHFAFAEGRAEVNTGELVVKAVEEDDVSKRASEVTQEAVPESDQESEEETDESSGDSASE